MSDTLPVYFATSILRFGDRYVEVSNGADGGEYWFVVREGAMDWRRTVRAHPRLVDNEWVFCE